MNNESIQHVTEKAVQKIPQKLIILFNYMCSATSSAKHVRLVNQETWFLSPITIRRGWSGLENYKYQPLMQH